jgi:hypothetical protein
MQFLTKQKLNFLRAMLKSNVSVSTKIEFFKGISHE